MSDEPLCLPAPDDPSQSEVNQADADASSPRAQPGQDADGRGADPRCGHGASQGERGHHDRRQRRAKRAARHTYPDEEQCLAALAKLAGLVALGYLTTGQANSIRASFAEILRWHRAAKGGADARRINDHDLRSMLRSNPELLSMLEPLLTDDQIEMVMGDGGENDADG